MNQCRILFLDGSWLDFAPPEGFNFVAWIKTVRSDGYVLTDTAYVRFDLVKCVLQWADGEPPKMQQNAPTTETKQ